MNTTTNVHYDQRYFEWQRHIGEFGGRANAFKFRDYIEPTDRVVDFGCGGGFLLKQFRCADRMGVEINPAARKACQDQDIPVVALADDIPNEWADVIISNHALEHTDAPLAILRTLYSKLRKGGRLVLVVPCESIDRAYTPGNIDNHLYSWAPINIGNLVHRAGFNIDECKALPHRWPPKYQVFHRLFGDRVFHIICRMYANLKADKSQTRVVARRPAAESGNPEDRL